MNKSLKKILCLISLTVVMGTTVKVNAIESNTVNEVITEEESQTIKVAFDEEIIEDSTEEIIKYVGDTIEVKGDDRFISYKLYADDELVAEEYRYNILTWIPKKTGEFTMRLEALNQYTQTKGEKQFKVKVINKDKRAPIIEKVDIIKNIDNDEKNLCANIKASGEGNITYKYELIKYTMNDYPTGLWIYPFRDIQLLQDVSSNNSCKWYEVPKAPIYDRDGYRSEYTVYILKVLAENEYGYDLKNIEFDAYDTVNGVEKVEFNIMDLNSDDKVDILDINSLSRYYGVTNNDSKYNLLKDLNCDGIIDIYDIVKIAKAIKA